LILVTEWNEFRRPDFDAVKARLRQPVIFDGRNIYRRATLEGLGFRYYGIGT
jgi:UDPglucose 6-dehydrogenase